MNSVAIACAAAIGLVLGALGGGGSILTVPVFVYVLHFQPKQAIAMSLPVVGITSLVGVVAHWREGHIEVKTAAAFGVLAMAGAYAGARLSMHVSETMQLTVLSSMMVAAGLSMLFSSGLTRQGGTAAEPTVRSIAVVAVIAVGLGGLTGLIGIGGGFLFVPALVLLARLPMKQAVGTSLAVITMNAAAGFAGYVGRVPIPWDVVGAFVAVASVGIIAGLYLVRSLNQATLRRAFGVFLLLLAIWMFAARL